jgi:uncharacterized paraquat-inducible protein A
MSDLSDQDPEYIRPAHDVRKTRNCLRCEETFASEWFGERICPRCKRSNAWKREIPPGNRRSGGQS